jgi:hypothetical protein
MVGCIQSRPSAIGGNYVRLLGFGRRFRTCVPCRLLRQQAVTAYCSPSWPTLPCLLRTQVWRNDVDATPAVRLLATAASLPRVLRLRRCGYAEELPVGRSADASASADG